MAWFPQDEIPNGWLHCDGSVLSRTTYPELHAYLASKYGTDKLPRVEDRFIRNAYGSLRVGTTQNDEIISHKHKLPISHSWTSTQNHMNRDPKVLKYSSPSSVQHMPFTLSLDGQWEDNIFVHLNTSEVSTGGSETRPKSIVFKLCIKAKNTFDDVYFWIKAYGEVINAGALDASTLAADLSNLRSSITQLSNLLPDNLKAELNKIKSSIVSNIIKVNSSSNGYAKLGTTGLCLQWGVTAVSPGSPKVTEVTLPVSYKNTLYFTYISESRRANADGEGQYNWAFIDPYTSNKIKIYTWYTGKVYWLTIGEV